MVVFEAKHQKRDRRDGPVGVAAAAKEVERPPPELEPRAAEVCLLLLAGRRLGLGLGHDDQGGGLQVLESSGEPVPLEPATREPVILHRSLCHVQNLMFYTVNCISTP